MYSVSSIHARKQFVNHLFPAVSHTFGMWPDNVMAWRRSLLGELWVSRTRWRHGVLYSTQSRWSVLSVYRRFDKISAMKETRNRDV